MEVGLRGQAPVTGGHDLNYCGNCLGSLLPHLPPNAIHFWSPNLIKDDDKLKQIQRRTTKIITPLRIKPDEESLRDLKAFF